MRVVKTKNNIDVRGNEMEIRYLSAADDRYAISRIYEESWKYAYQNIVPKEYLDGIPKGKWAQRIDEEGIYTLVMTDGDKPVGTSSFCRARMAEMADWGEIISIYLLPEYIGRGYGKLLLRAVTDELGKMGFGRIFLWALEDNHSARHFYERSGFVQSDRYIEISIGGKCLREVQYCYAIPSMQTECMENMSLK